MVTGALWPLVDAAARAGVDVALLLAADVVAALLVGAELAVAVLLDALATDVTAVLAWLELVTATVEVAAIVLPALELADAGAVVVAAWPHAASDTVPAVAINTVRNCRRDLFGHRASHRALISHLPCHDRSRPFANRSSVVRRAFRQDGQADKA